MGKIKFKSENLSREEGDKIKSVVDAIIDVIVVLTGGKSSKK